MIITPSLLALYLRHVLADIDLEGFDTEDMQKRTATYLTNYPESPRSGYVRKVLDYRYAPWGMGVGGHLYTGRTNFGGNLAKRFNDTWTIGVDLEIGADSGGGASSEEECMEQGEFVFTIDQPLDEPTTLVYEITQAGGAGLMRPCKL